MRGDVPDLRSVQRRTGAAVIGVNALSALAVFLYFNVIAPLPEGQAALRRVSWTEVAVVCLLVGLPVTAGLLWERKRDARLARWYERLREGTPAAEVPLEVRRYVLDTAPRSALVNFAGWTLVGAVASLAAGAFHPLLGFLGVGGLLASALVFFAHDLIWRPMIAVFFPEGQLGEVGRFRLPVLGRLLVVFLLVGIVPPVLLVSLSWQRAQALLVAPNPQAVLDNLLILEVFVLASGIVASVGLAVFMTRTITGPLDQLQAAMGRIQESEFDVRVPVTSNDELGYLSERLNEMAAGLEERERLKEAHRKVEQELAVAWTIQSSFLPDDVPHLPGWQIAATLEPARQTSGDFYDFVPLPGDRLGLLVADVADKGTPAALFMALSRTLIRTYALEHPGEPALALTAANGRICADTQSGLFVTVFYGVLDPERGTLSFCNAGHNPPYLLRAGRGGAVERLSTSGLVLGILEGEVWEEGMAQVAPGDLLVLYSDGIPEAQNESGAFFGEERLLAVLDRHRGQPAGEVQTAVLAEVRAFVGDAPQFDDLTLLIITREV
jgi:sigma-B regulation protein RsbU (phosphoserine phosphatase)